MLGSGEVGQGVPGGHWMPPAWAEGCKNGSGLAVAVRAKAACALIGTQAGRN